MTNPLEEYGDSKVKQAATRDASDMSAYNTWKAKPTTKNMGTLMKRFNPMIGQRVSVWKSPGVNEAAFRADLKKNAINAFETFDPTRGAQLRTHVGNRLKRSQRFNARYQNLAYIPEEKAALITPIGKATEILQGDLGKQPTNRQIATYLSRNEHMLPKRVRGKMNAVLVKTVQDYQIKDIPGSGFESDPVPKAISIERETLELLRPALGTEDEKTVFDFMYGKHGKPQVTSTGQIATRMGKSPSQVSRLKKRIELTYRKYM